MAERHGELALVDEPVDGVVPVLVHVEHEAEAGRAVVLALRRLAGAQLVLELRLRR